MTEVKFRIEKLEFRKGRPNVEIEKLAAQDRKVQKPSSTQQSYTAR